MAKLYHKSKHCRLYAGDSLETLKEMPNKSVDVLIFSPPYWQQRNYGISGQLGMESDYKEYLTKLLAIIGECKRVLKDTGSLWIVIDDTYNTAKHGGVTSGQTEHGSTIKQKAKFLDTQHSEEFFKPLQRGIPEYSRMGIPERLMVAMIDSQFWCLRNHIVWSKPNCMPESAKSRLTNSWEHVFFFTKQGMGYVFDTRYEPFQTDPKQIASYMQSDYEGQPLKDYDAAGAQNPSDTKRRIIESMRGRFGGDKAQGYGNPTYSGKSWDPQKDKGRIMRDVWTIPNKGYAGLHFATYPLELIEPIIEACCPRYTCNKCGFVRETKYKETRIDTRPGEDVGTGKSGGPDDPNASLHNSDLSTHRQQIIREEDGLTDCGCDAGWSPGGTVLDPFAGVCTTGLASLKLGRNFVGIDINEDFLKQAVDKVLHDYIVQQRLFDNDNENDDNGDNSEEVR